VILRLLAALAAAAVLSAEPAGAAAPAPATDPASSPATAAAVAPAPAGPNPLLTEWKTPFGLPPFSEIKEEHFVPAIAAGMAAERAEVDAIAASAEPPTFENTVVALDQAGELLARVNAVFNALTGADTNDRLQAINREVSPLLTAHRDDISLDARLFQRIQAVWNARASLQLAVDQQMLLERTWKRFVRNGAELAGAQKERLRAINTDLTNVGVKFGDDLLAETKAVKLVLERKEQLAGLSDRVVAGAAAAAAKAGLPGKWLVTLDFPSYWPFMGASTDRALRQQLYLAYTTKADHGGATDNKALASRLAALRVEKARLLGFATWADYVLDDTMAKTPDRVYALLNQLWDPAKATAAREAEAMTAAIKADGQSHPLEAWDWFYYREKVRKAKYDLDEGELRPYFALDRVRDGAFQVAGQLYGITFTELKDVPVYNPEVKAFEVKDRDGTHLAVFLTDFHPRPGKRSGAWKSEFRSQYLKDGKEIRPIVTNTCNFSRPVGDAPALLSLEEVRTLFHEFGHGLHSILAKRRYRSLSQTPRDFVELPSQIMENWATEPEVLASYARHWKTGQVIPTSLVKKIRDSARFDQGFKNVEYLAASLLDMEWHTLTTTSEVDAAALERIALARMSSPALITPRYRTTYFQHIFGPGGGYSAGYYSYKWAEVLDADAFAAFKEKGLFDQATARKFRTLLEKGGSEDAMKLYLDFRGRAPSVKPLLQKLGFDGPAR
jgi:peptidyl-dipeptidase Dcp